MNIFKLLRRSGPKPQVTTAYQKTDSARPTVAGEYEAKCMRCSRPMLRADKHCYLCTDCVSAK